MNSERANQEDRYNRVGSHLNLRYLMTEQFANSVDRVVVQGDVLTASGEMFLNEAPKPGLQPISPLPAGAAIDRFDLSVSCGG